MSDLQHIRNRIEQIRSRIESDPNLAREIAQSCEATHAFLSHAEREMMAHRKSPIVRRKIRRPDDGSEHTL